MGRSQQVSTRARKRNPRRRRARDPRPKGLARSAITQTCLHRASVCLIGWACLLLKARADILPPSLNLKDNRAFFSLSQSKSVWLKVLLLSVPPSTQFCSPVYFATADRDWTREYADVQPTLDDAALVTASSGVWATVGQYLHWSDGLYETAETILRRVFRRAEHEEVPDFIAVHIRHGSSFQRDLEQATIADQSLYLCRRLSPSLHR